MSLLKSNRLIVGFSLVIFLVLVGGIVSRQSSNSNTSNRKLQIVAGENFWGDLVSQLGGSHVAVTSIVSDPNADPHEYASSTTNARSFATADYVILNGAGYDSWGNKLLSANSRSSRKVLTVASLLGKKEGDNPHFWYSPDYVNTVVNQMDTDLIALDPADANYFKQQLQTLHSSLAGYQSRITTTKRQYAGTKVAATEDIFQYLSTAAGLDLISPEAFITAVAEGNDPPADSVVQFEQQLQSGQVHVLVYNQQTVTPLTESIKKLAADQGIQVIGVTETIQPPNTSYQDWMNAELINLQNALNARALGH
jgi:zinc/manganese transport system substrate-binding protein